MPAWVRILNNAAVGAVPQPMHDRMIDFEKIPSQILRRHIPRFLVEVLDDFLQQDISVFRTGKSVAQKGSSAKAR